MSDNSPKSYDILGILSVIRKEKTLLFLVFLIALGSMGLYVKIRPEHHEYKMVLYPSIKSPRSLALINYLTPQKRAESGSVNGGTFEILYNQIDNMKFDFELNQLLFEHFIRHIGLKSSRYLYTRHITGKESKNSLPENHIVNEFHNKLKIGVGSDNKVVYVSLRVRKNANIAKFLNNYISYVDQQTKQSIINDIEEVTNQRKISQKQIIASKQKVSIRMLKNKLKIYKDMLKSYKTVTLSETSTNSRRIEEVLNFAMVNPNSNSQNLSKEQIENEALLLQKTIENEYLNQDITRHQVILEALNRVKVDIDGFSTVLIDRFAEEPKKQNNNPYTIAILIVFVSLLVAITSVFAKHTYYIVSPKI